MCPLFKRPLLTVPPFLHVPPFRGKKKTPSIDGAERGFLWVSERRVSAPPTAQTETGKAEAKQQQGGGFGHGG